MLAEWDPYAMPILTEVAGRVKYGDIVDGVTAGAIVLHAMTIIRLGRDSTAPTSFNFPAGQSAGVVLKHGPGVLHTIAVSGAANTAVVSVYDGLTSGGTLLWTSGSMGAQTQPYSIDLHEVAFETGLCLVVSTANAGATIIYE